jgi:MoxR-like ATPase
MSFEAAHQVAKNLKASLEQVIKGRSDTVDLVLTGLLAGGHVLLEDYPGSGKTTLAKALGKLIDCSEGSAEGIVPFRRIQFTPDLLPSDVLGVNIFEPKTSTFRFQKGPVFSHVVLADELNRTGPKVQAAFLECMAEKQVTLDNTTYALDELFFVIGTQNPLDLAGTYPLPLVQLDRFLFRIPMRYVSAEVELNILKESHQISVAATGLKPAATRKEVLAAQQVADEIEISEPILKAIVSLVQSTRGNSLLQFGASTRSALMFKKALGAYCVVSGRNFASIDDFKFLAPIVLEHRLKFHPGAGNPKEAFQELIKPVIEKVVVG